MTTSTVDIVRYLNEYLFNTVWNSVSDEYRVNLTLYPLRDTLQSNIVSLRRTVVGLPTTDTTYMTYYFPFALLEGSVTMAYNTWVNALDILNTGQTRLSLYDTNGRIIPASKIWILLPEGTDNAIVAIAKRGMTKCLADGINSTVYLTAFKDSNLTEKMTGYCYDLNGLTGTNLTNTVTSITKLITSCLAENANGVFLYINGYEYDATNYPTLQSGDFVDVILDMNVFGQYTVTVDDNSTGYQSTLYNGYREILHCPKAINPTNIIFTHDSATLAVRNAETGQGVYLHRQSDVSVKQITHNDISVDRQVLNALTTGLGASTVTVNVRIRKSPAPRTLQPDACFIEDLYLLDDATIISMLQGSGDSTMTFWGADYIENSSYITLMYSNSDVLDPTRLATYVAALGYYQIAAVLSGNIYSGTYQDSVFVISKPLVMQGTTTVPMVYINGRKVPQASITYRDISTTKMEIYLDTGYPASQGDSVLIRLFNGGSGAYTRFSPLASGSSITMSRSDLVVYQEVAVETPAVGYKRQSSVTYVPVPQSSTTYQIFTNTDGTYAVTFMPAMFGNNYIIQPEIFMYFESYDIDTMLADVDTLVFPVYVGDNTGVDIPMLGQGSAEVYINGYQCVNGVDFIFNPLTSGNGTALTDVIVTNRNLLKPNMTGNLVEVFIHSDVELSLDVGYAVNNLLYRNDRPSIWYSQVSNITVEGVQKTDVSDNGMWLTSESAVANGALYQMSVIYPKQVVDLLSDYSGVSEQQRLLAIDTYMARNVPQDPAIIPVSKQHEVYSPWLTAIINDMVNGKFSAANDPNLQTFLLQFSAYDYLKDRDPTLSASNLIDRRFVAVSTSYANFAATTALNTIIIQKLIQNTLVTANSNLGDTLT